MQKNKQYIGGFNVIIVRKEYQNQGVGTELLTRVLEVIKEEGCTYAIMQSGNPAVQHSILQSKSSANERDATIDMLKRLDCGKYIVIMDRIYISKL